jgi:hypothetical protein
MLLSRVLEQAGVKVRIWVVWSTSGYRNNYHVCMLAKDYGQSISTNELAILTSDTRFYRWYLQRSSVGMMYEKYGIKANVFSDTATFKANIIADYSMPRFRNYVATKIREGKFPSQLVDKSLMLFTNLDADSSMRLQDRDVKDLIINRFDEYIDYIAIKFSNNKQKVIKDIDFRMREKGKNTAQIRQHLNNAVTTILNTTREFDSIYSESKFPQLLDLNNLKTIEENYKIRSINEYEYNKQKDNAIILDTPEMMNEIINDRDELLEIINNTVK